MGKEGKEVHNRFTATPAPAASEVCYSALFSLWSMELQGKPDRLSYLPSQTDIDIYIYIYMWDPPHSVRALVQPVQTHISYEYNKTEELRYAGAIISNN